MVLITRRCGEVPAELRLLADQLCQDHGIPWLNMVVINKLKAARFNGAAVRIDIPASFDGRSDYERWSVVSVAHEVAHAYRHVRELDRAKAGVDNAVARALRRLKVVVVVAAPVVVVGWPTAIVAQSVTAFWLVLMALGIIVAAGVVLIVGEVQGYAVSRPDEAATDALAHEWGYPVSHAGVSQIKRAEPWWRRPLPVWARSHPRPMDRHLLTTNDTCEHCRSERGRRWIQLGGDPSKGEGSRNPQPTHGERKVVSVQQEAPPGSTSSEPVVQPAWLPDDGCGYSEAGAWFPSTRRSTPPLDRYLLLTEGDGDIGWQER